MIIDTKVNLDMSVAVVDGVVKIRADNPAQQAALENLAERFSLCELTGPDPDCWPMVEFDGNELLLHFHFSAIQEAAGVLPSAEDLDAVVAEQSIAEVTALPEIPSEPGPDEESAT